MNRLFSSLALAVALVALGSSASPALAHGPYLDSSFGRGFYGGPYGQSNLNEPTLPYYAVHPPVYYNGVIIRRSYGTSPFGTYDFSHDYREPFYRPHPPVAPVRPLMVVNPHHVPASSVAPSAELTPTGYSNAARDERPQPKGILILNPHVRQTDRVASSDR